MARITQDILSTILGLTEDPLGRPLTKAGRKTIRAGIPPWHPRNDGEADAGADGGDGDADADADSDADAEADVDADADAEKKPDFKAESRKHERRSKAEKARADKLQAELDKVKTANQSAEEKALQKARDEGKQEALTESQKERRADRLELAVTKAAAKVKIKVTEDGEEKTKTVRFADSDDVLFHIQREIAKGEIDEDEIFDADGKVKADALTEVLVDLAGSKPRWLDGEKDAGRLEGDSDARKGDRTPSDDEMSVADHVKAVRRNKSD